MVRIIDTPMLASLLRAVGTETFLVQLTERIRLDFAAWASFDKCARMAAHSSHGVLELMPTSDNRWFSFKLVNGHPRNPARGLLTVTAVGMLADVETGYPLLISEMTVLTALRTAATSAMAARALARCGCRTMALIGTGAQAEYQALAFKACLGIDRIQYFDTDPRAMRKFALNLRSAGLELEHCASAEMAVAGADVVTTATAVKGRHIVLSDSWIRPGVHVNGIGGDCPGKTELDPALLRRSRVFVEYLPQSRIEGEIQSLGPASDAMEIWQVVAGNSPGRLSDADVTVFDSVGFALEDFSALRYVLELSERLGIGGVTPIVPQPVDPKDLYGYMQTLSA